MTAQDFAAWLNASKPGDRLEYHRGELARDRGLGFEHGMQTPLGALANRVYEAHAAKLVALVQQRHGHRDYSYIVVRRHG